MFTNLATIWTTTKSRHSNTKTARMNMWRPEATSDPLISDALRLSLSSTSLHLTNSKIVQLSVSNAMSRCWLRRTLQQERQRLQNMRSHSHFNESSASFIHLRSKLWAIKSTASYRKSSKMSALWLAMSQSMRLLPVLWWRQRFFVACCTTVARSREKWHGLFLTKFITCATKSVVWFGKRQLSCYLLQLSTSSFQPLYQTPVSFANGLSKSSNNHATSFTLTSVPPHSNTTFFQRARQAFIWSSMKRGCSVKITLQRQYKL